MKKLIKLTESDLRNMINESIQKVLINEGFFGNMFGKKQPQKQVQQQVSPMQNRVQMKTNPDGTIAKPDDPLDERICVNGTMDGLGDRVYFGKKGSLPWYYQSYPSVNNRQGFNHMVLQKNGGKFSQIQYFRPEWQRGGGMTITFWKVLNNQELQGVWQVLNNPNILNSGIDQFVKVIDSLLTK